jgi:hypothetical protein
MDEPLTPPASPKPPPTPEYIPPPVIYPRPRHKPIFDAPLQREPHRRSATNQFAIAICVVVAIPVGIFWLLLIGGMLMSPQDKADYERHSQIERVSHMTIDAFSADPSRNQYRRERWVGEVYCGEANPTNRVGGYDGWRQFSWDASKPKSEGFRVSSGIDPACGLMMP